MTAYSFSDHIRDYTKKEHADLEKELITRIRNIHTTTQYIELLSLFYHYYAGLEQAMATWLANDERIPDFSQRRKAAAILADINALNSAAPAQETPELPAVGNFAAALGVAYVLEGSTLGGTIIAKMISKQLQVPAVNGFTFFNGYGEDTKMMWERFRSYLDALNTPAEQEAAAVAAKDTFINFKKWAHTYGPIFKI